MAVSLAATFRLGSIVSTRILVGSTPSPFLVFSRNVGKQNPFKYKSLPSKCYRRIVHYPKDGQYTTEPLQITKLGGRDPVTGRKMVSGIGGGYKQVYHWVFYKRTGPKTGPPLVDRVEEIRDNDCRTAKIALIANGDQKRWILATVNMKVGDLVKTSGEIPRIPVRAVEGDCYPLGALTVGTLVNSVEMFPGHGSFFAKAAGTSCQILRKIGNRVIVQIPSKREVSLSEECLGTVGQVSNPDHDKEIIGSPNRNRWLGNRPRSGLWHRKDGYCGRKIRPMKPLRIYDVPKAKQSPEYQLTT